MRRAAWSWIAFLLLILAGCADPFQSGPGPNSGTDEDGDGFTADIDCDDKDKDVYPTAPERENCKDDNCNGQIDEGTENEDKDHDGFCPSTGDAGDCEGNFKRHPGMPEDGGSGSGQPNGIDDNCNGQVDESLPGSDMDKDGFSVKDGDCNDSDANINPGAIEVEGMHCKETTDCPTGRCYEGYCRCLDNNDCNSAKACVTDKECSSAGESCKNGKCMSTYSCQAAQEGMPNPSLKVCRDGVDNDCDKKIDEMPESCDDPAKVSQTDPFDYARAIELCDTDRACGLDGGCPGALKCRNNKCTRVLTASFNADADARAHAIADRFAQSGPITPRMGKSFAILSSGLASYLPSQVCPQSGTEFTNVGVDPDTTASDKEANDMVALTLEVLVPTNAQSFDFDFQFLSTEYPEWVGSEFNDTFWVQLNSKKFNGNISFDKNGTPIRINNSFFDICDAYPAKPQTSSMCSQPATLLDGTGYAKDCSGGFGSEAIANGGSTGWLHTTSPVTPGETIKLTFYIFDKGDHVLDSAVLIDNWRWKLTPANKPTTGPD